MGKLYSSSFFSSIIIQGPHCDITVYYFNVTLLTFKALRMLPFQ
ncbi:hypothetical protein HNO89_001301 [Sporosarcina luteola]|nr:hypothetical protein [Sporosarcina luteola]